MCYSFRASLIAYSLGMASAVFAITTKQYILGTIILFYCQIQLAEGIIWRGIDTDNINLNKIGTTFAKHALPLQALSVGLGYILSMYFLHKLELKHSIPLLLGVLFYLYVIMVPYNTEYPDTTYPSTGCVERSCQNNDNRLKWPFPTISWYPYAFILYLGFVLLVIRPINSKLFLFSMFIGTVILAYIINPVNTGTMWCFASAILAPLLVLINYFFISNKDDILT